MVSLPSPTRTTVRSPVRFDCGSLVHMTYLPGGSGQLVGLLNFGKRSGLGVFDDFQYFRYIEHL